MYYTATHIFFIGIVIILLLWVWVVVSLSLLFFCVLPCFASRTNMWVAGCDVCYYYCCYNISSMRTVFSANSNIYMYTIRSWNILSILPFSSEHTICIYVESGWLFHRRRRSLLSPFCCFILVLTNEHSKHTLECDFYVLFSSVGWLCCLFFILSRIFWFSLSI